MKTLDVLGLVALMVLWGGNFVVIQLGTEVLHPLLLTTLRFTFALFPLILFVPRPQVAWRWLLGYGLCFGLGVWGMMVSAIALGLSAGMAGLLLDLSLVFSLVLGYYCFRERISSANALGALLALVGLVVSIGQSDGSVPYIAVPLCLVAAASWSLMGAIVKRSQVNEVFAFSIWGMLFAPPVLLLALLLSAGTEPLLNLTQDLNGQAWFSILFQAYPTTVLGYWYYNRMTLKYGLSKVAPFTLLNPVFALVASVWVYQEAVAWDKIVAFALILLGFALGQWGDRLWPRKDLLAQSQ